jgi:hypothetical protein
MTRTRAWIAAASLLVAGSGCGGATTGSSGAPEPDAAGTSHDTGDAGTHAPEASVDSDAPPRANARTDDGGDASVVASACELLCNQAGGCVESVDTCSEACVTASAGGCAAEAEALVACAFDSFVGALCGAAAGACTAEQKAFAVCRDGGPPLCQTGVCVEIDGECECSGKCFVDGDVPFAQTRCSLLDGKRRCSCTLNGQQVGSCTPAPHELCALETSCCIGLFTAAPQPDV